MKAFAYVTCLLAVSAAFSVKAQDSDGTEQSLQTEAQSAEAELTEEEARMQEVVCRTEPVTGSRSRVNRTCLTRAEWRANERRTGNGVSELQRSASGSAVCRYEDPDRTKPCY